MAIETPTVLVVDDDVDISTNLCDILEELGFRTNMAHDGPSALELMHRRSFDLALLDFKMPGMDGATLYEEIRKVNPELIAIMVTAFAGDEGIQRALDAGTWKILPKPLDIPKLLRLLKEAIKKINKPAS